MVAEAWNKKVGDGLDEDGQRQLGLEEEEINVSLLGLVLGECERVWSNKKNKIYI